MIELAHSRPHSDMISLSDPQVHPMPMQSRRVCKLILEIELHVELFCVDTNECLLSIKE